MWNVCRAISRLLDDTSSRVSNPDSFANITLTISCNVLDPGHPYLDINLLNDPRSIVIKEWLDSSNDTALLETRPAEITLPPRTHMNGDAAGSVLPGLSDDDIYILDAICKLAANSQERPSKAIFGSYDQVLKEQGIESRHDNVLFRWVMRIIQPKPGYATTKINFVQELRALLAAHGITIVDDSGYQVADDAVAPVSVDRRRVSFDDAHYEETWLSNHSHTFERDASEDVQSIRHTVRTTESKHIRAVSADRMMPNGHDERIVPTLAIEAQQDDDLQSRHAELEGMAEAFLDTTAVRSLRRIVRVWFAATDALLLRQHNDEMAAVEHDYRMLAGNGWQVLRAVYTERAAEREDVARHMDCEQSLLEAPYLTTKRIHFNLWTELKDDVRRIEDVAARHMLRFRSFQRWKALTLQTNLICQNFLLKKYHRRWSAAVTKKTELERTAAAHRRDALLGGQKKCFARLQLHYKEACAMRQHDRHTIKNALFSWRQTLHTTQDAARKAIGADRERVLHIGLSAIARRYNDTQANQNVVYNHYDQRLLSGAMNYLEQYTRLALKSRELRTKTERKTQRAVLSRWVQCYELQRTANQYNKQRRLQYCWNSWNDALRMQTVVQRINQRLKAEVLYKLMLEERSRLCLRTIQARLLRQSLNCLVAKSSSVVGSDERRLLLFAQESRRRKLAGVFQHLHLAMRRRDDAERAAVECINSRVLPRAWTALKQSSSHVQELQKWAEDAFFFVATRKILKVWASKAEQSRQTKRHAAYDLIRARIKERLLKTTFAALQRNHVDILSMTTSADQHQQQHEAVRVIQVLQTWRQYQGDLATLEVTAAECNSRRLCRSAIAVIRRRYEHRYFTTALAIDIRSEVDAAMLSDLLKRLRSGAFALDRLADTSMAFRKRSRKDHMKQMLRHLALTAAERRARARDGQEQEPESPSIRPASRAASRSESQPSSVVLPTANTTIAAGTPAYLRTPSRTRRINLRSLPTPAPFTPFTFTPGTFMTTPGRVVPAGVDSRSARAEQSDAQITPFIRRLQAGGIATDLRPTSILRPRLGVAGTGKSVRFTSRLSTSRTVEDS